MTTKINPATQIADGTLPANVIATNATNAVNATNGVPAGTIIDFSGVAAPAGYLACPLVQTNISRTTYAALFAAISTAWGIGDGSTTFGMPWFPADYASVQANANVGTQTVGALLAHTHQENTCSSGGSGTGVSGNSTSGGAGFYSISNVNTVSTGGAANLAAGVRILKCVKY